MLIKIMLSLLISCSYFAYANSCFPSQFKYKFNKKDKFSKIEACKIGKFLLSSDCQKEDCKLVKQLQLAKVNIKNAVGSPHFWACHKIDGRPVIGELYFRGKWYKKSLCFDSEFKSFVEGAYILKMYQKPSK